MSENPAIHTKEWAKKNRRKYNTSVLVPYWARDPHPGAPGDRLAALSFADRCLLGDAICRLGTRRITLRLMAQVISSADPGFDWVLLRILQEAKESDGPPFQKGESDE